MYERVILPTDGSELSFKGVEEGLEAAKAFGIPALAVYVIPNDVLAPSTDRYRLDEYGEETMNMLEERLSEEGRKVLSEVKERAEEHGVELETVVRQGRPYQEITSLADDNDIIYICSHGWSGFSSLFLGSTTNRILKHTDSTVAVVKAKE